MRNIQSQSFTKRQRVKRWLKIIAVALVFLLAIYGLFKLSHAGFMNIDQVEVFGADQDITDGIQRTAYDALQGDYLWLFPRSNSLIYPKSQITSTIAENFPRVQNVIITRDGLTKIRIAVNQKIPVAIVCPSLPNFEGNILSLGISTGTSTDTSVDSAPCYFADKNGFIFQSSSGADEHAYNIYYDPDLVPVAIINSTTTDYIGAYATSTDEFAKLQSIYDGAKEAGMPVDGILMKEKGEYELYASSTIVYFNDEENIPIERENLILFWKNLTDRRYDYIDLRYGSNVFYKMIK